jgi:hypothetical protein
MPNDDGQKWSTTFTSLTMTLADWLKNIAMELQRCVSGRNLKVKSSTQNNRFILVGANRKDANTTLHFRGNESTKIP